MQVWETSNWLPAVVEQDIEALCAQLHSFTGYRTIWLDLQGRLWHAEPDDMLEDLGHRYVGTFLRPTLDDLTLAVARALPIANPAEAPRPAPVPAGELAFA